MVLTGVLTPFPRLRLGGLRLRLARGAGNEVQGTQHKQMRRRSRAEPKVTHIGEHNIIKTAGEVVLSEFGRTPAFP